MRLFRQGYRGWACIDNGLSSIYILCRHPASASMPRQIEAPLPYGTYSGQYNYSEGAAVPLITIPAIPQNSWWTLGNLRSMLTQRTVDGRDLSNRFRVTVANTTLDAPGIMAYRDAICAGFDLVFAKGESLAFNINWMGCSNTSAPSIPAPASSTIGTFANVGFTGAFAGSGIIGGRLEVLNNVSPILQLNDEVLYGGSVLRPVPTEIVSGTPQAMLTLQHHGNYFLPDMDNPGSIVVGGISFRIGAIRNVTPYSNQQSTGRVVRNMTYLCLAPMPGYPVISIE